MYFYFFNHVVCRPEVHLNFDDDLLEDVSGNHLPVMMENVTPYRGAAYFNGQSKILINRFSNTDFRGNLVIKMRYKEDLRGASANSLQALVTNGECGEDPSVIVAKMPGYVLLGAKTSVTKSFALPVVVSLSYIVASFRSKFNLACILVSKHDKEYVGLDARKPVFRSLGTTKTHTSLRILAD